MDRSSHIEIHFWSRRLVGYISISNYSCLVLTINRIFDIGAHPHLLLEVDLRERIALLPILDLSISLVNEMVACSNMVVSIVFNTLNCILFVEIEIFKQSVEELVFDWHLLLSREEAHVSVSVFYLQGPCVTSDVVHCVSCVWVSV